MSDDRNFVSSPVIEEFQFWGAVSLFIKNYHAINKKLFATKLVLCYKIKNTKLPNIDVLLNNVLNETLNEITEKIEKEFLKCGINYEKCDEFQSLEALSSRTDSSGIVFLVKCLPKGNKILEPWYNIVIIDFMSKTCQNIPFIKTEYDFKFSIIYADSKINISPTPLDNNNLTTNSRLNSWCSFVLLPKIQKWAEFFIKDQKRVNSLNLIELEEYNNLYKLLKNKYGQQIVQIWPENTDPLKHVYEDIAIATYLILLWQKNNIKPKKFVDLGCGNGLLVHILNSEGYDGYGLDIRKRKIWSLYPATTNLFEELVVPDKYSRYNGVDWLIGNHSDELSAWIPIMAAMISYHCGYFLLPCCAFELNGNKFQRRNCQLSVYNDFINYTNEISQMCGFETMTDRLKIPSTKRIALIGFQRKYPEEEYKNNYCVIEEFVQSHTSDGLKYREKVEEIRNCTKLDKQILNDIVMKIFNYLMSNELENLNKTDQWRNGRIATISELVDFLTKDILKQIKAECGGLKTLLKNNHDIFQLTGDKVQLRYPKMINIQSDTSLHIRKRACFFYYNHPDGCPLSDDYCSFKH